MVKIIHAADLHLDSPFAGLTPEKARQRRVECRDGLYRLSELARRERAQLVLMSGDLFDGGRVYPETLECLRAALREMGCPVFIAPGNHDPYGPRSPYAASGWPENVHIFTGAGIEGVELPELGCAVHGAAFQSERRTDPVLEGWTAPKDGLIHILCLHGNVGAPDSAYGPVTPEQLGACGAQYAALGHVHQCSGLRKQGATYWAYPGCPEGRGFDETGDKGVLVGSVGPDRTELRFEPLCKRRYWVIESDVTGTEPAAALERAMPPTAPMDICRVEFTGETGERGVDLAVLSSMFRDRFYSLELRDRTRAGESLWARAGEDTLRGLTLQKLKERCGGPEDRELVEMAARFVLAALDGRDRG